MSELSSLLSPFKEVRKIVLKLQRKISKTKGWIVVGRDITTRVLPDAELKIFLTADLEKRVKRREKQQILKNNDGKEKISDLKVRDERDRNRFESPLKKSDDAWEIDTTELSIEETVKKILKKIEEKY
jgi:cytidylate kinase